MSRDKAGSKSRRAERNRGFQKKLKERKKLRKQRRWDQGVLTIKEQATNAET